MPKRNPPQQPTNNPERIQRILMSFAMCDIIDHHWYPRLCEGGPAALVYFMPDWAVPLTTQRERILIIENDAEEALAKEWLVKPVPFSDGKFRSGNGIGVVMETPSTCPVSEFTDVHVLTTPPDEFRNWPTLVVLRASKNQPKGSALHRCRYDITVAYHTQDAVEVAQQVAAQSVVDSGGRVHARVGWRRDSLI